ncbi:N-acetylmuramoyl-L-alanine amidase [Clostridium sp. AL.422]|uniref:N-acetylmuramoyl-L-alanine amidase family protein n=1 Tax=Clostridium TaxID=1485 RepID=UPI00293DA65F|nr:MULTISPECIES: N-acetylmuramoyl-L-alanine amidase [unclassified Clostridium]MDV4150572.1 N-acetylmuramoyl-L-alanine amidase [Clostridium sp. AL.422]
MEKPKFDISYKRKLLHKRNKRRKIIFRLSLLLIAICTFTIVLLIKNNSYTNNKVKLSANMNNEVIICIDPGHGDWDTGAKGSSGALEKDIVLDISLKLGKLLEESGIKVVYTRTNDSLPWLDTANDSLKERIKISEVLRADLFISIHCNSDYDNKDAKGIETWYKSNDENSKNLALTLQNALVNLNYTEDRNIKTYEDKDDALAVLELNTGIPALLELGFLSNSSDERFLKSDKGQDAIANSIKKAILNYIQENKSILNNKGAA